MNLRSIGPEQADQIQACQSADEFRQLVESEHFELFNDALLRGPDGDVDWEKTRTAINELLSAAN
ncbi:MAG: hypothetical protein IKF78_11360 [Atopobiaceae bacterium]|nr:hypothetical protein [Atopobiaceae bacterium]